MFAFQLFEKSTLYLKTHWKLLTFVQLYSVSSFFRVTNFYLFWYSSTILRTFKMASATCATTLG